MKHLCPVCGYPELSEPAEDHLICPCCGTHFGYDDFATSHDELRREWLAKGAPWFSRAQHPPQGWDPVRQLAEAGMLPFRLRGSPGEHNRVDLRPDLALLWTAGLAA